MTDTATLKLEGKELELPVIVGSEGEKAVDITKLRAETGYITFDPAYGNTGSCNSDITFINGEQGILRYRGIPIEEFADGARFTEVAWLLIFGKLPSQEEKDRFSAKLTQYAHLNENMKHHFDSFPQGAPPMAILSAMINTMSCFHPHLHALDSEETFEDATALLISKIRTIAAYSYRSSRGLPYVYPDPKLTYSANFLHMMFSMPFDTIEIDPDIEDALNLVLILHADHEQNCSTSTVRMVGSSQANLFASCSAGVCALWGPLHGGANVAVLDMLGKIHAGNMSADDYIKLAKDKSSDVKLMGFGHRVYKNRDPRAEILKVACDKVLGKLGIDDPLLGIAQRLEEVALQDSYFVDRKLFPNVDFYSGIIMRALNIPLSMFTVMFAMGRLPGWIAQWKEQRETPGARICRPRQVYTGETEHKLTPKDQR